LDTDEITFSEQLFRIFEFEPDSPVTLERIACRVHPEDVETLSAKVELARKAIEEQDYEIRLLTPNGAIKYVRTKSFGFRNEEGRLERIGAIQDVTERRLSEETLANLRSELAHVTRVTSLGVLDRA
jgi:PAS domain-containing protein